MMFGWTLICREEKEYLELCAVKYQKVVSCHRWFAGWKDLDIIWDYIMQDTNFGGIDRAREDYAIARETDRYGKPGKDGTK